MGRKLEEIIEELEAEGQGDLAEELKPFTGGTLRKAAEKTGELEAKVAALEAENKDLKEAPKRESAFRDYGIDLEGLKPAEAEVLKSLKPQEGEITPEWIGQMVEKYQFPVVEGAGEQSAEVSGAREVVAQARAGQGRASATLVIRPEDAATWSAEKWAAFQKDHSEQAEQLLRGKDVTGVPA